MVTTIQLNEKVREALARMKEDRESFEDVIVRLMRQVEEQKRKHIDLMIEGAKATAEESLKITREFEAIEEDFDWEWKDEG
jgi:predicted CopG family antitoxin